MEGESREVGKVHGALARAVALRGAPFARPCVILSGGETTVTIRPRQPGQAKGRGGRAGEFCLGLAGALAGRERLGAGGRHRRHRRGGGQCRRLRHARHAGARRGAGRKLADHLDRNDAYGYFDAIGDLCVTGPTHTNVNDFRAMLTSEALCAL